MMESERTAGGRQRTEGTGGYTASLDVHEATVLTGQDGACKRRGRRGSRDRGEERELREHACQLWEREQGTRRVSRGCREFIAWGKKGVASREHAWQARGVGVGKQGLKGKHVALGEEGKQRAQGLQSSGLWGQGIGSRQSTRWWAFRGRLSQARRAQGSHQGSQVQGCEDGWAEGRVAGALGRYLQGSAVCKEKAETSPGKDKEGFLVRQQDCGGAEP